MEDFIIVAILVLIVALAALYIYKAKKSGQKCIGCPYSGSCSAGKGENACSCCCSDTEEKQ